MNIINGGIVYDSIPFPRGDGHVAVRGCWTGGEWKPGSDFILNHFKDGSFSGTWKVVGIDLLPGTPLNTALILRPESSPIEIESGDIFVFGVGAYSVLVVESSEPELKDGVIIHLGKKGYRALLLPRETNHGRMIVFHELGLDFSSPSFSSAATRLTAHEIRLSFEYTAYPTYSLEFNLSNPRIRAGKAIETLLHARAFVLNAGMDKMNIPYPKKKDHKTANNYFEPELTAQTGSVKLFLHSPPPTKVLSFDRSDPLKLMFDALKFASEGDSEKIIMLLRENLRTIEPALTHLEGIVRVATSGDVSLFINSSGSSKPIPLGLRAHSAIAACRSSLEQKTLVREGILYALESKRLWCRFSSTDNDMEEDWTLRFPKKITPTIEGKILPRGARVEFQTTTPPGSKRGKGILLSIEDSSAF